MNENSSHDAQLFIAADDCDLERAVLSPGLSSSSMDSEKNIFHATIDRLLFSKPTDMVQTVLEANGFVPNLENIISALDQMAVGIRGKIAPRHSDGAMKQVRTYWPCLSFKMPVKGRIGPLLKKFYSEIDAYEAEIERLRAQRSGDKSSQQDTTISELHAALTALKAENVQMQRQLESMSRELSASQTNAARVEKAMVSGNLLPEDLRLAVVKEVLPAARLVSLKSNRKLFSISMSLLAAVPAVGDHCLVHVKDGTPRGVFLFENLGMPFRRELATVMCVEAGAIKIRLRNRRRQIIEARNETEEAIFRGLRRDAPIILRFFADQIVGMETCENSDAGVAGDLVQEQIAAMQISFKLKSAHAEEDEEAGFQKGEAS